MSLSKKILFYFLLSGFGLAFADDAVRQFSSELMLIESKQVLHPDRVFKYSDATEGEGLKRLLNPSRIPAVVDVYLDEFSKGVTEPNILTQLDPLLKRYSKAFNSNPSEYEAEYLDSQTWLFRFIQKNPLNNIPQKSSATVGNSEDAAAMQRLVDSIAKFNKTVLAGLARNLRDKARDGMFSAIGVGRAISLANSIDPLPASENALFAAKNYQPTTRTVMGGEQVYKLYCVACHATGVAGSPKSGDINAWIPRLKTGLTSLVQSTLRGKGAMAAQGGGDLSDIEVIRATVYLANTAGGKYLEPALPMGHSGQVDLRPQPVEQPKPPPMPPYADLDSTQKLLYGERVYYSNCIACHQANGRAAGPIAALVNAPSLKTNDVAIQVILNGRNRGAMPGWRFLSNEDIAAVINYTKAKFNNDVSESVRPEDVRNLRR
jgi:cytochrome c5